MPSNGGDRQDGMRVVDAALGEALEGLPGEDRDARLDAIDYRWLSVGMRLGLERPERARTLLALIEAQEARGGAPGWRCGRPWRPASTSARGGVASPWPPRSSPGRLRFRSQRARAQDPRWPSGGSPGWRRTRSCCSDGSSERCWQRARRQTSVVASSSRGLPACACRAMSSRQWCRSSRSLRSRSAASSPDATCDRARPPRNRKASPLGSATGGRGCAPRNRRPRKRSSGTATAGRRGLVALWNVWMAMRYRTLIPQPTFDQLVHPWVTVVGPLPD